MQKGLIGLLLTSLVSAALLGAMAAAAQPSNGSYTLLQDTISSGGDRATSSTFQANTVIGLPAGGRASNAAFTLTGGLGGATSSEDITVPVTVVGTVNDPASSVIVNDATADVDPAALTYSAQVRLPIGPNTITSVATDRVGNSRSASVTICVDLPPSQKTERFSITVRGAVNELLADVSINGVAAAVDPANGTYAASVPLVSGMNLLTATATDRAGNAASTSIHVFVPVSKPPAMPTIGTAGYALPAVATGPSLVVGGTKTPGTAIWINGQLIVSANDALTWSATITLVEGDNVLLIVAKDAAGQTSAEVRRTVVLDQAATPITISNLITTNFNPFLLTGTVEDSLTTVDVAVGAVQITAQRFGTTFQAGIPLAPGGNSVAISARSPNGHPSSKAVTVTLGTVPSIQTWQPPDGAIIEVGTTAPLQVTAVDAEADPITYQIAIDGEEVSGSADGAAVSTPDTGDLGRHAISFDARDAYGGNDRKDVEAFVVRQPVPHP